MKTLAACIAAAPVLATLTIAVLSFMGKVPFYVILVPPATILLALALTGMVLVVYVGILVLVELITGVCHL